MLLAVSQRPFQAQKFGGIFGRIFFVAGGLPTLTDIAVRKARAAAKPYKKGDGKGLSLLVMPAGGKTWRMDYRFDEKRRMMTFGRYPEVRLVHARAKRDAAQAD